MNRQCWHCQKLAVHDDVGRAKDGYWYCSDECALHHPEQRDAVISLAERLFFESMLRQPYALNEVPEVAHLCIEAARIFHDKLAGK